MKSVIQVSQLFFLCSRYNYVFLAQDIVKHFVVQDRITFWWYGFLSPSPCSSPPSHSCILKKDCAWNIIWEIPIDCSSWHDILESATVAEMFIVYIEFPVLSAYLILHNWQWQKLPSQLAISHPRFAIFPSSPVSQMSLHLGKPLLKKKKKKCVWTKTSNKWDYLGKGDGWPEYMS